MFIKKPTKFQLFFNGAILIVIVAAIYFSFKPYIDTPNFRLDEVREMDRQITSVSADNVVEMLKGNEHPVMLVIYASWCPVCKEVMPQIVELMKAKKLAAVIPVFVSMDNQPRELSKYLVYNDYNRLFAPYMIEQTMFDHLRGALAATGSHYAGGTPYIGFFDINGKMVGEISGLTDKETILKEVNSLGPKQSLRVF